MDESQSLAAIQMSVEAILRIMERETGSSADTAAVMSAKTIAEANVAVANMAKNIDISDKKYQSLNQALNTNTKEVVETTKQVSVLGRVVQNTEKALSKMTAAAGSFVGSIGAVLLNSFKTTMDRSLDFEAAGAGALLRGMKGAESSVDGLNKSASSLGIRLNDLSEIYTKHTQAIGLVGIQSFDRMVKESASTFKDFGMTMKDGTASVARYIEHNQSYILGRNLTEKQILQMSMESNKQTHLFAQQLKLSREEIENRRNLENLDARAQAYVETMDEDQKVRYQELMAKNPVLAKQFAQMYAEELELGAAGATEGGYYRAAMATGQTQQLDAVMAYVKSGQGDVKEINRQGSDMTKEQIRTAAIVGANAPGIDTSGLFEAYQESKKVFELLNNAQHEQADEYVKGTVRLKDAINQILSTVDTLVASFVINQDIMDSITTTAEVLAKTFKVLADEKLGPIIEKVGKFVGEQMLRFANWLQDKDLDAMFDEIITVFQGIWDVAKKISKDGLLSVFKDGMKDFFSSIPKEMAKMLPELLKFMVDPSGLAQKALKTVFGDDKEKSKTAPVQTAPVQTKPAQAAPAQAAPVQTDEKDRKLVTVSPPVQTKPTQTKTTQTDEPIKSEKSETSTKVLAETPSKVTIDETEEHLRELVNLQRQTVNLLNKINNRTPGFAS